MDVPYNAIPPFFYEYVEDVGHEINLESPFCVKNDEQPVGVAENQSQNLCQSQNTGCW